VQKVLATWDKKKHLGELHSRPDLPLTRIKRIDIFKECIKTCLCACVRLMSYEAQGIHLHRRKVKVKHDQQENVVL
jgi:hypothetical protein